MRLPGPVLIRGGGDIATGTICRLHKCGFKVVILEAQQPTAIRRTVSLSEAVFDGAAEVEGVKAVRIDSPEMCETVWSEGHVPILIDPDCQYLREISPYIVIDAILAKKNMGTTKQMAPITIGLGPGFQAPREVDAVIETMRGHKLGRIIYSGKALPNTGVPGTIGGHTSKRVLYAETAGQITHIKDIGAEVNAQEPIATIANSQILSPFAGLVRGMIRNKTEVRKNLKIADIDPRLSETENCYTLSDKSRTISGGVLEAILHLWQSKTTHVL